MEDVRKWLIGLNLAGYYEGFIENGYDDLEAIRCLEDEDLDAIGITDPTHRHQIKSRSQQQQEEPPADDADAFDFENVLSDLDTIIGELGAFGNQPGNVASKPTIAPKPTVAPKPSNRAPSKGPEENRVTVVTPVKRTSTVFVETETGQTRVVAQDPAEDFDLDSLLYDIVKFDPNKVVQQHSQSFQPTAVQQQKDNLVDMTDSVSAPSIMNEQELSAHEENVETFVMPDLRSASMMISEEEVKQRIDRLTDDLRQNHSLSEEEIKQKIKDEKLRIALEKMKLANVKKVAIKIYNADGSTKTVVVEEGMTAVVVCHMLVVKNMVQENPKWALIEKWEDLGIERIIEDHEIIVDIYCTWPRQNSNTLIFKLLETKYDLFENPTKYFPAHLSVSAEFNQKHGAVERAEKARKILLQEYFSSTNRVPEIEGILYSKEGYKKPWKKFFFILRSSGLYYSTKGKSKLPKNLRVFVQFEGHDVYYGVGLKKLLAAPSEFCFCLKASVPATPSVTTRDAKVFCAESEQAMNSWLAGVRLAKYGLQLRDNYHKSHVTQFKLEELESGSEQQSVEQRQQKLTGMIVEHHLDRVRHEYQKQQEEQEQHVFVKQTSAPAAPIVSSKPPPLHPSSMNHVREEPISVAGNSAVTSSSTHRSRVLPPVPTPVTTVQSSAHVSSPVGLSTSLPVTNSIFTPLPPQQPPKQKQPVSMQSFPWYHGDISRDIAVKRLEEFSMTDGTFLIRQSRSCVGTYVLTMAAEGIIRNFQIQPHPTGILSSVLYRIDDGPEFASIQQLIDHYAHDADRLPCRISCFCPK